MSWVIFSVVIGAICAVIGFGAHALEKIVDSQSEETEGKSRVEVREPTEAESSS